MTSPRQYLVVLHAEHIQQVEELFPGAQIIEVQGMGIGNQPGHQVLVTPMQPSVNPVPEEQPLQVPCCG